MAPKIAEQWGSLKQNPNVMGMSQKWGSVTSKVGAKLSETKEQVGESVEHWKEEQEKKKAMANSGVAADGSSVNGSEASTKKPLINEQQKEQLQQNLEATKTKVVEGWTSGMSWVSQRIKAQHEHQQQQGAQQQQQQPSGGDQEMNRLDSDGLPSSFRK